MVQWLKNIIYKIGGYFFGDGGGSYTPIPTLQQSLVAHWKMNDNVASTVVLDSSGNNYHGTAQQNTSVLHTTGKVGGALTFNGTSDYIDTNNTFQSVFQSDFSISLWAKPTDGQPTTFEFLLGLVIGSYSNIIELGNGINGKIYCYYIANYPTNPPYLTCTSSVVNFSNGQQDWHHIVFEVYQNGSKISGKLYFDSVLVRSATSVMSGVMSAFFSNKNLYIGASNDDLLEGDNRFSGSLDNVMIFNKALSQEEIDFLWNNGNGREDFQLYNNLNTTGERLFAEVGV